MDEFVSLDAIGQAEAVRTGAVSPREAVEAAIARIEAVDGRCNAVVHRRFEQALAEAGDIPADAPFRGVPILLKDIGWRSAGDPYGAGSKIYDGVRIEEDSHSVAALRRAGFVVLGRTNVPELATTITTEPAAFGPTRNPYDPAFSAGGSSGGSAAAVAAGMVAVATASDGGGSIRIPASLCGLVGLKPTRGRTSLGPYAAESWGGLSVEGVVTRTVRDTAALLDVISGAAPGDPYAAPALPGPLAGEVGADPGRLRIGFVAVHPRGDLPQDPDVAAAVTRAAGLLESLGHDVTPGHPDALADAEFPRHYGTLVAANVAAELEALAAERGRPVEPDELEPRNRLMIEGGRAMAATDYLGALRAMNAHRRRMATWWTGGFDLLLTPTVPVAPYPLGWISDDDLWPSLERAGAGAAYTSPFNSTGQPAISLPLHRTAAGLPVGVQLVAAAGREDLLIRVASQIEAAQPFEHPMAGG
ncbi:amidase [Microbispora siamensis]|uniref:6-aminohexanoate-cyclic-dimer hydrolase n=1 Tax=Microbispora siamensis TaxID=564413 RepID=A0ABQ4GU07_9ACTN|nr:amidase [Microbispora siamensis]GIH64902.1 6-aminohexanoate-cyclic-dimer hydrolase [Microbispora siamensis]